VKSAPENSTIAEASRAKECAIERALAGAATAALSRFSGVASQGIFKSFRGREIARLEIEPTE
jgi:hypothetical protein